MEKLYLVKYNGNYADEFDVYFHLVMSEKELEEAKGLIQKLNWEYEEFYFGTNEAVDLNSKDLLYYLNEALEITQEQFKVLQDLDITGVSFGDGLNWDSIVEHAYYQIENEE